MSEESFQIDSRIKYVIFAYYTPTKTKIYFCAENNTTVNIISENKFDTQASSLKIDVLRFQTLFRYDSYSNYKDMYLT